MFDLSGTFHLSGRVQPWFKSPIVSLQVRDKMERQGVQVKKLEANHAHLINRNNFKVLIFQVSLMKTYERVSKVRGQVEAEYDMWTRTPLGEMSPAETSKSPFIHLEVLCGLFQSRTKPWQVNCC